MAMTTSTAVKNDAAPPSVTGCSGCDSTRPSSQPDRFELPRTCGDRTPPLPWSPPGEHEREVVTSHAQRRLHREPIHERSEGAASSVGEASDEMVDHVGCSFRIVGERPEVVVRRERGYGQSGGQYVAGSEAGRRRR